MCNSEGLDRMFDVRSPSGSVLSPTEQFTTRMVARIGRTYVKVSDDGVVSVALRILSKRIVLSDPLRDPGTARKYLALRFAGLEHEVFSCLFLDSAHRVIACVELSRGSIDGASVSTREVVKQALAHNARSVILVHNHPSGATTPSEMDTMLTQQLKRALGLVDVKVLDHLIVGDGVVDSMAERGLI